MTTRTASCRCGQLRATATGEPVRVSVCHCLDCKKRSGSAFAVQARWPAEQVTIEGRSNTFINTADSGNRMHRKFCPVCGTQLFSQAESRPNLVFIRAGALDDPEIAKPSSTIWVSSAPSWACIDQTLPQVPGQPAPIAS